MRERRPTPPLPEPSHEEPRTVSLAKGERLVFRVQEGVYQLVYYRPRTSRNGRSNGEERFASARPSLLEALEHVFGQALQADERGRRRRWERCPHDAATVELYMRSTGWGRNLP